MKQFGIEKKQERLDERGVEAELCENMDKYIKCLEKYPERKAALVADPDWIQKNFSEDLKSLKSKMEQYPEMAGLLALPLGAHVGTSMLSTFFRDKLLLRDDMRYSENPPLIHLLSIKEELSLPLGFVVNPRAKQIGIYSLSREEQEILENARTLFARGIFEIGDAHVEFKVELDLLMAQPGYTDACKELFRTSIIQPNMVASQASLSKHMPDLIQTYLQHAD